MSALLFSSRPQFEHALAPDVVRTIGIMQLALMVGPLVYAVAVLALVFGGLLDAKPSLAQEDIIQVLTIVHVLFGIAAYSAAPFLFKTVFGSDRWMQQEGAKPEEEMNGMLGRLRAAIIVRLALFEGVAFFGITVCLVAAMDGVLAVEPLYWVNIGSVILLQIFGVTTFPSKERLLSYFDAAAQPA